MPGLHIPVSINIEQDNIDGAPVETIRRQEEKKARRVYLKATDFETHGYSDNCDGCSRLQAGMEARPHTETCRARLEEELAKGDNRRWKNAKNREMDRTATYAALVRVREEREKRRKLESPDFEPIGNPSLEERASRAKMEGEHVEHVEPSSSRDHIRRDRPVGSEEEESNKLRLSDPRVKSEKNSK